MQARKNRAFLLLATAWMAFIACGDISESDDMSLESPDDTSIQRDLPEVLESGVLKAITLYSSTNYFLYRGQPMGYEYEVLSLLAKQLGLRLEIVIADDIDELFQMLKRGEGDIAASGLTIIAERRPDISFTEHLYLTKQVLVQRKPIGWRKMMQHQIEKQLVRDAIELIGDTVYVRKSSSYFDRLKHLQEEIGGNIVVQITGDDAPTEKLISMVAEGRIKYTVADLTVASVNASYYPDLDVNTPISFSQRIAWAVRRNSPLLLDTVNTWIAKMKKYNAYYAIYDKYFKSSRSYKKRIKSDFYSEKTGKISPYDDLIQKYVEPTGWDWRLISSLIFQESHFDPQARSWATANGLMQLMPATAQDLGVTNMSDPNQNIRGGVKYLRMLWKEWETIEDSIQRLKFTFASYNCGLHHVRDAQRLAKKYDMDPGLWDENVETQVLNLTYSKYFRDDVVRYGYVRGKEPVNYVREIFERYEMYKQFVPD